MTLADIDPAAWTLLARAHGHLAVLATVLLLHPVLWLRGSRPVTSRVRLTAGLGAGLLTAVFVVGWNLYPLYRSRVKPVLIAADDPAWSWFESKEHLALVATALAVGGAAAVLSGEGATVRLGHRLLAGAVFCAAITAALGMAVGTHAHPAW